MHRTPRGGDVARDSLSSAAATAILLQASLPLYLTRLQSLPLSLSLSLFLDASSLFLSTSIGSASFSLLSPPSRRTHVADSCVGRRDREGTEDIVAVEVRERTRVMYREREREREREGEKGREADRRLEVTSVCV